jgi:hypothetical protein
MLHRNTTVRRDDMVRDTTTTIRSHQSAIIDGSYVPSRVIALSLCIDPMHLKNVLRQVQSDRSNLVRGWLPFAAESMRQQFGSQMPQGAIHPVIQ